MADLVETVHRLHAALKRISQYQTPEQLHRRHWKDWGLDNPHDAVEMAYENVLHEAKIAIKGIRLPKRKGDERG